MITPNSIRRKVGSKIRMSYKRWALRRKMANLFRTDTDQDQRLITIFRKTVSSPNTELDYGTACRIAHNPETGVTILMEVGRVTLQDESHTVVFSLTQTMEEEFIRIFNRQSDLRASRRESQIKQTILHTIREIEIGIERRQVQPKSSMLDEFKKTTIIESEHL